MSRVPVSKKDRVRSEARKRRIADSNLQASSLSDVDVNALIAQYLIDNPVGGSILKPVAFESGSIPSGSSGVVLTRTAPENQTFRLTALFGQSPQSGMTLTIDGTDIIIDSALDDRTPNSTSAGGTAFIISENYASNDVSQAARILTDVYCTSFSLTKVAGATGTSINYAYQTLEAL